MPASTLLLITIGFLGALALIVHSIVRYHASHSSEFRRVKNRVETEPQYAEWLQPSGTRDYRSASA